MRLTRCELRILKLLVEGHTNASMAALLYKDLKTIEPQRKSIMTKLGCKTAVQLGYKIAKEGLV